MLSLLNDYEAIPAVFLVVHFTFQLLSYLLYDRDHYPTAVSLGLYLYW